MNDGQTIQENSSESRKLTYIGCALLVLILLIGGFVRFYGLDFGLPLKLARPDEQRIEAASTMLLSGTLRPRTYRYPPLFSYMTAIVRSTAMNTTHKGTPVTDHTLAYLCARTVSALCGILTIAIVFILGRIAMSNSVGLIAAFLLALTHLHVRDSHFGVTDTALTMFVALTMIPVLMIIRKGSLKSIICAACCAGFAFATKYTALFLLIPIGAAIIIALWRRGAYFSIILKLSVAGGIFILTFLVITPHALFEYNRFIKEVAFELGSKTSAETLGFTSRGWTQHFLLSLRYGLGAPLLIAALIGVIIAAFQRNSKLWIIVIFMAAYYIGMGSGATIFVRYMLPVIPFTVIVAALTIVKLAPKIWPARKDLACAALAIAVIFVSAFRTVHTDRLLAAKDTRLEAALFLEDLVGEDEKALLLGRYTAPAKKICSNDRFVIQKGEFLDKLVSESEAFFGKFRYVVWGDYYFGSRFSPKHKTILKILKDLEHVQTFSPLSQDIAKDDISPVFNSHDKIYLPYAGFSGFTKAGPFIHIYKVKNGSGPK